MITIREWLREIREAEKKSQRECAEAIGVTTTAYCNYETGFRKPRTETAKKIADALNFEKYGLTWHGAFFGDGAPAQKGGELG